MTKPNQAEINRKIREAMERMAKDNKFATAAREKLAKQFGGAVLTDIDLDGVDNANKLKALEELMPVIKDAKKVVENAAKFANDVCEENKDAHIEILKGLTKPILACDETQARVSGIPEGSRTKKESKSLSACTSLKPFGEQDVDALTALSFTKEICASSQVVARAATIFRATLDSVGSLKYAIQITHKNQLAALTTLLAVAKDNDEAVKYAARFGQDVCEKEGSSTKDTNQDAHVEVLRALTTPVLKCTELEERTADLPADQIKPQDRALAKQCSSLHPFTSRDVDAALAIVASEDACLFTKNICKALEVTRMRLDPEQAIMYALSFKESEASSQKINKVLDVVLKAQGDTVDVLGKSDDADELS